jgi:cyclic pyranopterin monophosphate synthase
MSGLTHFDDQGASRMVDVGGKPVTERIAIAEAFVSLDAQTLRKIQNKELSKGDVFEVARLAGIMAAKKTSDLIPLCHPLGLDSVTIDFETVADGKIRIVATTKIQARTGVEMESLTAASICALTIYDMCKAIDRGMSIGPIQLVEKRGGKSGTFLREDQKNG